MSLRYLRNQILLVKYSALKKQSLYFFYSITTPLGFRIRSLFLFRLFGIFFYNSISYSLKYLPVPSFFLSNNVLIPSRISFSVLFPFFFMIFFFRILRLF